jgi:chemosensory pili system protein ChpA (sensor histidine kinase/response regulator)
LPIIVITSRTADRHRAHAEALGVQGYLGKPYREEGLLLLLAETLNAACPIGPDTPGSGTANSTLALSLAR